MLTAHLDGLPPVETGDGFEVIRVRSGRKEPFRASLTAMAGYVFASIWSGMRLIREWKPDVIHGHFRCSGRPGGARAPRLSGVPYVLRLIWAMFRAAL